MNLVQLVVILAGFVDCGPVRRRARGRLAALTRCRDATDFWYSTGPASGWRLLFSLGPAFIVSPGLLQKAFGARDERAVRRGIAWNGFALLVFAWAPAVIGLAAHADYPSLERTDLALPTILASALPPSIGIVALAAVFSAEVSSADAVLFMLATSASRDLYRRLRTPARDRARGAARGADRRGGRRRLRRRCRDGVRFRSCRGQRVLRRS